MLNNYSLRNNHVYSQCLFTKSINIDDVKEAIREIVLKHKEAHAAGLLLDFSQVKELQESIDLTFLVKPLQENRFHKSGVQKIGLLEVEILGSSIEEAISFHNRRKRSIQVKSFNCSYEAKCWLVGMSRNTS